MCWSSALVLQGSWLLMHWQGPVLMFGLLTKSRYHRPFTLNTTEFHFFSFFFQRPDKVAEGHADGIQPRTIEVFQVRLLIVSSERLTGLTFVITELRPGGPIVDRRKSDAHGCMSFPHPAVLPGSHIYIISFTTGLLQSKFDGWNWGKLVPRFLCRVPWLLTFTKLTDRVPDVTAPTARYPFEVFSLNCC